MPIAASDVVFSVQSFSGRDRPAASPRPRPRRAIGDATAEVIGGVDLDARDTAASSRSASRRAPASRPSTSPVVLGLEAARELGMLTIAFSGRDGGRIAELAEFAFVVPSFGIHRIQEVQVLLLHLLWDQLHVALGAEDVL